MIRYMGEKQMGEVAVATKALIVKDGKFLIIKKAKRKRLPQWLTTYQAGVSTLARIRRNPY